MFKRFKENFIRASFFSFYSLFALFFLIALLSYDSADNTFFKFSSTLDKPENLMGHYGSYIADFSKQIFGFASFLIPIIFFSWSISLFYETGTNRLSKAIFPFCLIFFCILLDLSKHYLSYKFVDGGILGKGMNSYLLHFTSEIISNDVLLIFLVALSLLSFFMSANIKLGTIKSICLFFWQLIANFFLIIAYLTRVSKNLELINLTQTTRYKKSYKSTKNSNSKNFQKSTKYNQDYSYPPIDLLDESKKIPGIEIENKKNTEENKNLLKSVLSDFKINGEITSVKQGPIVTLFELTPAPGTLSSSVVRLADDIARSMSAISTRISTMPGKDALGIEIPNKNRETVFLRELLDNDLYKNTKFKLPLTLGKDIFGNPVIVDLSTMPHLLVAGTTGSGKSVGINAMLLSLLYFLPPEECRLILIDPKMLELSVYQDIPHLLTEVVTDPKKAISALKWTVKEMENRYKMMQHLGVREIEAYNLKVKRILDSGEVIFKEIQVGYDSETGKPVMEKKPLDLTVFPKIVVVVDELADLMITSGKEIEGAIQRLSQMARAAGIHLIVATQRPSVDVITGTIKSNFPTRISYKVVNKISSRTILEEQGAEQLLGQGDLLITMFGEKLLRVHGPYVKTEEVQSVVDHLKKQGEPEYLQSVTIEEEQTENFSLGLSEGGDELYNQAVAIVCREKKASTSFIQRHLQIGYNRAARIIERMESEGVVSPANHVGRREVLVGKDS